MPSKKFKNILNIVLCIIIIAIIILSGYIYYEYVYLRKTIDANASDILEAFDKYMNDKNKEISKVENIEEEQEQIENSNNENNNIIISYNNSNSGSISNVSGATSKTGYGLTYGGYGVLGKIELPAVGLKYPVLETLTDANAIDVSVAMQYGART